jgi:hypothetical protein
MPIQLSKYHKTWRLPIYFIGLAAALPNPAFWIYEYLTWRKGNNPQFPTPFTNENTDKRIFYWGISLIITTILIAIIGMISVYTILNQISLE